MADDKAKQPYNAGRRIRWLAAGIAVAIVAYTGGWYWLAGKVETEAGNYLAAQAKAGTDIECPGLDVLGYPFRLEVFCTALDISRPETGFALKGGALRTAAQVYDPSTIYAELDSPVALTTAGGPVTFSWRLGQASAHLASPLPQRASMVVEDLSVDAIGLPKAVAAAHAEAHMRVNGPDLDLAWRYEGLSADERFLLLPNMPVISGDADFTVKDGATAAANGIPSLRGMTGEIRRAAILVTPKQGILASGPFSIDADGLIDATLELIVVDPKAFADTFSPVFPDFAPVFDTYAAMPTRAGPDGTPEIPIPLTIAKGVVRVGYIEFGAIPPVD